MPKIRITHIPQADNGLQLLGEGGIKPLSNNTIQFTGPSHEDGGVPISYQGNPVEVEGQETGFRSPQDNAFVVLGNMKPFGSSKKFKTLGKEIGEKEAKASKMQDTATNLINASDPYNQYQMLGFNSGRVLQDASNQRLKTLSEQKQGLADLQNYMLETAEKYNIDPQKMKYGGMLKYDDGGNIGTVAERHNNPGNMKYAAWMDKYGAVPGEKSTDGGNFAKFPDSTSGIQAMQNLLSSPNYSKLTVGQAIKRWTNGTPYDQSLYKDIINKKVSDLSAEEKPKLYNAITTGEDNKPYNSFQINTRGGDSSDLNTVDRMPIRPIGQFQTDTSVPKQQYIDPVTKQWVNDYPQQFPNSNTPKRLPSLADNNKLGVASVLPELLALGQRPDYVAHQQYNPDLLQPYSVSFQDRLNQNQSSFRDIEGQLRNNPAALSALAAQKYSADSGVLGEQFRTNQGISNVVANKNTGILNDAQLKNLQLQDQQFTRQAAAIANTRLAHNQALNSISSKIAQNQRENNDIRLQENLFNYRPDANYNMQYAGPAWSPTTPTVGAVPINNGNNKTTSTYDGNGRLIRSNVTDYSDLKDKEEQLKVMREQQAQIAGRIQQKWGGIIKKMK